MTDPVNTSIGLGALGIALVIVAKILAKAWKEGRVDVRMESWTGARLRTRIEQLEADLAKERQEREVDRTAAREREAARDAQIAQLALDVRKQSELVDHYQHQLIERFGREAVRPKGGP